MGKYLDEFGLAALCNTIKGDISAAAPKMVFGHYTGNGQAGADSPNSLTFDFEPDLIVFIGYNNGVFHGYLWDRGNTGTGTYTNRVFMFSPKLWGTDYTTNTDWTLYPSTGGNSQGKKSADGKTVYWYDKGGSASYQLNVSGVEYYYIAFGTGEN